jgi:UDP-3-O-[3-hydroxymyristoyl] N-acetylglucosamine deacetylase
MNTEGLRYPEEFVRHKMLDAVGDLALAGAPVLGSYRSVRGGHRLNAHVLQALFADQDAWTVVRAPWVRDSVPVDLSVGMAAVNYAADRS